MTGREETVSRLVERRPWCFVLRAWFILCPSARVRPCTAKNEARTRDEGPRTKNRALGARASPFHLQIGVCSVGISVEVARYLPSWSNLSDVCFQARNFRTTPERYNQLDHYYTVLMRLVHLGSTIQARTGFPVNVGIFLQRAGRQDGPGRQGGPGGRHEKH